MYEVILNLEYIYYVGSLPINLKHVLLENDNVTCSCYKIPFHDVYTYCMTHIATPPLKPFTIINYLLMKNILFRFYKLIKVGADVALIKEQLMPRHISLSLNNDSSNG